MKSELIIMLFSSQDEAFRARVALEMLHDNHTLGLETSIILTKDSRGRVTIHERRMLHDGSQTTENRLPGRLGGAILGDSDVETNALIGMGLDTLFLDEITSAFKPNNSVLLCYISQKDIVDTQRLLSILPQFRGTLYHTTFSKKVEEQLQAQLV